QQSGITIPKPLEEARRALDVGEEECDRAARKRPHVGAAGLPKLPIEEAQRHDPVPFRRPEETLARALTCGVVLEVDLIEPGAGGSMRPSWSRRRRAESATARATGSRCVSSSSSARGRSRCWTSKSG